MTTADNTPKSCASCDFFIGARDNDKQVAAYGGDTPFASCAKKGMFMSPTASRVSDPEAREEHYQATAESCDSYTETGRVRTIRRKSAGLSIGLQMMSSDSIGEVRNADGSSLANMNCSRCVFYSPEGGALLGAASPLCLARAEVLPDTPVSNVKTASNCQSYVPASAYTNPLTTDEREKMIGSITVTPGLTKFMDVNDMFGYVIREQIAASKPFDFVEPTTYETDMEVTEADRIKGIRAWRKIMDSQQKRSVMVPIFDAEFFSEDERKKIPQSGDKEHPEMYQDHANNTYKVATLWFKMDETPCLQGVAGTGKGHPVDTKVLTPQGWKRVGDLQVGDHVVGSDGKPTRVRGVFDRGVLPVNRVTMNDGSSVLVDNDHIWRVRTAKGAWKNVDTTWLKGQDLKYPAKGKGYKFSIPMVDPVEFEEKDLLIHPYVLGVLLANGALGGEAVYSSNDDYVIEKVGRLVTQVERTPTPTRRHVIKDGMYKKLIKLGLNGRVSAQKFIPEEYMIAAPHQRRNLLQGLIDCDGSCNGGHLRYHTTSEHLASGVVELVQSLGGTASIQRSSRDNELCVNISMGDLPLVGTPAKFDRWTSTKHRKPGRKIKSIESAGTAEVRCISVEAADELYVTENYIVTHNTEFYRYMSWLMQLPFERVSITRSSELDDLAGKMLFENNETVFQPGRIPKAWSKPGILCLDEPNVGPVDVWQFIRPLTDNSKQLVLDMNNGETIIRHEYCRMGMAINPSWDSRNIGAEPLADADSNRLAHIYVDFPAENIERSILNNRCKSDGYDLPDSTLNEIMEIAKTLRTMSQEEDLPITWGIRQQIKVARATEYFDLEDCYKMAATDNLEPEVAEMVLLTVRTKASGGWGGGATTAPRW